MDAEKGTLTPVLRRGWGMRSILSFLLVMASLAQEPVDSLLARATAGDGSAQFELGMRYMTGDTVERDPQLALDWLRRAAESDHADALWHYGLLLVQHSQSDATRDEGRDWQRRAAESGHALALMNEGVLAFDAGDMDRARQHFRSAAESGDVEAQHGFATMLLDGELGAKETYEGMRWLRSAAAQGHGPAQERLARAYALGDGVESDIDSALFWWHVLGPGSEERNRHAIDAIGQYRDEGQRALVRLRAASWRPGAPAMPYAGGVIAYEPDLEPGRLPSPYTVLRVSDAVAQRSADGGTRLWLSPALIVLDGTTPADSAPGLLVELMADGKPDAMMLSATGVSRQLDPAGFEITLEVLADRVSGSIRNADTDRSPGVGLDVQFAIPLPQARDGVQGDGLPSRRP